MSLTLSEVFVAYRDWISRNPQLTSDIESAIKWISYFVSGKISDSSIVSELVYSISNLLVLFNDKIILQSQTLHSTTESDKLKTWLTILEYSEVFIEVTALKVWGERGRWVVIVMVQLLKCVARLMLLFHHKEQMIQNPPVAPLERKKFAKDKDLMTIGDPSPGFRLQSGRVIRRISSTGPVHARTWTPPELPPDPRPEANQDPPLNNAQLVGEAMYIVKPVLHLGMTYYFNPSHWVPWMSSLALDGISLQLLKQPKGKTFSSRQQLEIARRNLSLLLYLLKSPFYESYTKERLNRTLLMLSDNVPFVGMVLRPLAQFIPRWQETYFYMWST